MSSANINEKWISDRKVEPSIDTELNNEYLQFIIMFEVCENFVYAKLDSFALLSMAALFSDFRSKSSVSIIWNY